MHEHPVLSVQDLSIAFGGEQQFIAVNNLSFSLGAGKTLAIVGESGSGKSLTALSLMGLQPSNARVTGSIELKTERSQELIGASSVEWQRIRGRQISMVFQEPMSSLNPVMKIGKQLTESILEHQAISTREAKLLAIDWLSRVKLPYPERIYHRYPHQLSGGQKQRVMIAMAMCNRPALLIADEPTTALDVTVQKEVVELMQELQQQSKIAMIFITHDLALAAQIADDALVMYRGEAVEYGKAAAVFHAPEHPYTQALVACKPSAEHKGSPLPVIADFMEGRYSEEKAARTFPSPPINDNKDILVVNDLKVWFADEKNWLGKPLHYYKAVDGVSFTLRKGEVLGLVGESGSGKSTVSRSLMGLLPVREGEMIFDGKDLASLSTAQWREVRKDIQMIFQDPFASLNPRMSVGDMLIEPLSVHNIVPSRERVGEAKRLLDLVQLPADSYKRYPHQFSGGQRQRLGIARALALRPKLLICDESVSALDVSVQAQILNLLKELQAEFDLSYLFISHDLSVVHYISDRVIVMRAGQVVESGNVDQVLTNPQHEYTQKLVASIVH
ncbi:ABC transporter ATP-binding protein [Polluticoccus soli]|uniref:ABC transporter ATP-binding protein n=1 Tax=Polluticoccus soli TaxID=3034150 RepID=UPI0023E1E723|nr:ABC transporter ATP-binding protein [Flavipsychrobacter sp. JY13-12]